MGEFNSLCESLLSDCGLVGVHRDCDGEFGILVGENDQHQRFTVVFRRDQYGWVPVSTRNGGRCVSEVSVG